MSPENRQHLRWGNLRELPAAVSDVCQEGHPASRTVGVSREVPHKRWAHSPRATTDSRGASATWRLQRIAGHSDKRTRSAIHVAFTSSAAPIFAAR